MGRHKRVSDEAVLDAARGAFVELGYGASTREISRRAGVSEAVLFQRHKTKLDLFFAAMVPPPVALAAARAPKGRRKAAAGEEIEALALQIMAYFREAMPVLLQLVTHPSFRLADLADRASRMPLAGLTDALAACLERQAAAGAITRDASKRRTATLTLLATLHSLALFERMGLHGGSFPDKAVRNVVALVVAGLRPEKGSPE